MIDTTSANNSNSMSSTFGNACQGARKGFLGGMDKVKFAAPAVAVLGLLSLVEVGSRAIGNKPSQPLLDGDCQLQQFRDVSMCTNSPLDIPSMFCAASMAVTFVILAETISGAVTSIFEKKLRNNPL